MSHFNGKKQILTIPELNLGKISCTFEDRSQFIAFHRLKNKENVIFCIANFLLVKQTEIDTDEFS